MNKPADLSFQRVSKITEYPHAALGKIQTWHGVVKTPAFFFCATKASLKAVEIANARALGVQLILCNTYHLMLRPGADTIRSFGGLQNFTAWHGPMFSDSGGFQIFSMGFGSIADEVKRRSHSSARPSTLLDITEHGARFRSYIDGRKILLSPENSIEIQEALGADLIVQLDECTPFHASKAYTAKAMRRSLLWAKRCAYRLSQINLHKENNKDSLDARTCYPRGLYGVIQGGIYKDLRHESIEGLAKIPFFGLAIGGSLGKDSREMADVIEMTMEHVRSVYGDALNSMPVHLLGIGDRRSIFQGVRWGIASFDCVSPTRIARHGQALLKPSISSNDNHEKINLFNARFKNDETALDASSAYPVSLNYSRGYLHYLLKAKELAALSILSMHNIGQMTRLMSDIRQALQENTLDETQKLWCST